MRQCSDITEEDLATTNGCGSSYWLVWVFRIPKFISKSLYCCCGCHDMQYQRQIDKVVVDLELIACVRNSALSSPCWQKHMKWIAGDLMYFALNTKLSQSCYRKVVK